MTARARRASPPIACAHCTDRRDCGTCSAAAHERAVMTAEVRLHAAPPEALKVADAAHTEALDVQRGHRILRENGIAFIPTCDRIVWAMPCPRCGTPIKHHRGVCERVACPGRRVRCELPEVRGR